MQIVQVGGKKRTFEGWVQWAALGLLALHLVADVVIGLLILAAL